MKKIIGLLDSEWRVVLTDWMRYKSLKGENYIVAKGLELTIKKLRSLSGGSSVIAQKIVNQSIENNWKGVFELKTENYNDTIKNSGIACSGSDGKENGLTLNERKFGSTRVTKQRIIDKIAKLDAEFIADQSKKPI